ncbi:MAG: MSMEG_0565 family glycosyltransferase [Methanobacteriota archaeon]|nr:MAG: MSMEG_0565 family glycosyltransferase [Euryarchaeota archaeon]
MKIAMLTYSTKPRGGVVHALNLSEALADMGHDVHLFSLKKKGERGFKDGFYRKTAVPHSVYNYSSTGKIVSDVKRMIAAYRKNLPLDFDIYHSQDCVGANALFELKDSGNLDAPTVRTIHHIDEFRGRTLTNLQEKSVHLLDEKIVVSNYWKEALKKEFGVNTHLIYNGIDLSKFGTGNRDNKASSRPSILYVGGLEARKGVEFLLLAAEQVIDRIPNVKLTIVGKSGLTGGQFFNEKDMFADLAERIGIHRNVVFKDFVSDGRLPRYYRECDVFVLPSRMEGWGLTLMEAMAFEKPVIAYRVGGIPELVDDGKSGVLLECGDVRGLAESMVKILTDKKLAARLGKAARKKVEGFSWKKTAKGTLEVYRKALRKAS